ncbi:hypothetical protein PIB30_095296, partial [Stylosanthes scabra]|nr:hypothetical protein [Stylosanthes scabra]
MAGWSTEKLQAVINGDLKIESQLAKMKDVILLTKKDDLESFVSINILEKVEVLPPILQIPKDAESVLKVAEEGGPKGAM